MRVTKKEAKKLVVDETVEYYMRSQRQLTCPEGYPVRRVGIRFLYRDKEVSEVAMEKILSRLFRAKFTEICELALESGHVHITLTTRKKLRVFKNLARPKQCLFFV